jgi:hypothetical protein
MKGNSTPFPEFRRDNLDGITAIHATVCDQPPERPVCDRLFATNRPYGPLANVAKVRRRL